MAKDKERSINPAQQARKQEKNRALKKAKNEQQARRNENLSHRNPDRIQRQIDDLKALESSGEIKPREKAILADLERDLRAVKKAREALGEKAPNFGNARPRHDRGDEGGDRRGGGVLGKRGRDGERRHNDQNQRRNSESGDETDESVRAIPMPRDTPPPVPREFRRNTQQRYHHHNPDENSQDQSTAQPAVQAVEHKTTYSSAPQLRDLRKEATSRFVPTVVKKKQDAIKGVGGGLLEPEEMDQLEAAGYYKNKESDGAGAHGAKEDHTSAQVMDQAEARRLEEEEARFERDLAEDDEDDDVQMDAGREIYGAAVSVPSRPHQVQIEEVEDEDL